MRHTHFLKVSFVNHKGFEGFQKNLQSQMAEGIYGIELQKNVD
jgi:hypothetical protein